MRILSIPPDKMAAPQGPAAPAVTAANLP